MVVRLEDNVLNQRLAPEQPKFKIWSSAGLMLTYWCPSRCACCYVFADPQADNPQTQMSVEMALGAWRAIRQMAGPRGKVHITGGEPFGDYDRLKQILQGACEEKLEGLEKIETNAFWCTSEQIIRERLKELKSLGLKKLQISTDVYHQEYISLDLVQRAVEVGRQILGPNQVQVRWRDFLAQPVLVAGLSRTERDSAFADALNKRKERLLGRAAEELVNLLPQKDYNDFAGDNCARNLLAAQHVHIDGAGNVFSGTCLGIVTGRISTGGNETLERLWRQLNYHEHPIFSILLEQGPVGLLKEAKKYGYQHLPSYASKCHICYDVRRFLHEMGLYPVHLGPDLCYGIHENTLDKHEDKLED